MPLTDFNTDGPNTLELRKMLRRGEVSATELTMESLRRATTHDHLGAFVSLQPELALREAAAADQQISTIPRDERTHLPSLLGIPTAHKDLIDQRGHVTTHGSAAVPHRLAVDDSALANSIRTAGAISIGKTQVPEFGIAGYSENEIANPARNPHDTALTAGGSSGGTAAAIASGIIPAAIGSDAGGSIRIPAAACGLIGLKPGRDIVPSDAAGTPSRAHDAPRMGVSGPIARSALDAAVFFDAIMGSRDERFLSAVQQADDLRWQRIGVSFASPFSSRWRIDYSADARTALDIAIERLEARRHIVQEADIVYDSRYPEAFTTVWTSSLARIEFAPGAEDRLGALAAMFLEQARNTEAPALQSGITALHEFAASAIRQWSEFDVVLTPALAFTPPKIGEFWELGPEGDYRLQCEWAPQTSMVNVSGMPAITVPTHMTSDGLPMGVQLIGQTGAEAQLLQLAEQLTHP